MKKILTDMLVKNMEKEGLFLSRKEADLIIDILSQAQLDIIKETGRLSFKGAYSIFVKSRGPRNGINPFNGNYTT